jgi:SAM-dependent methyltransferase
VLHEDRARAGSFGEDADAYDRARPTYPPALVDALAAGAPRDVLDIGCGTGIAARLLGARGCRVLGVEPDPRMAAVARRYGLAVEVSTFEGWDPAGRRFDLLTSGQAWHWVHPDAGAAKAATVLRPGGRIGLFWNRGQLPEELRLQFDGVYARHAPELRNSVAMGHAARDRDADQDLAASLRAAGFGEVEVLRFAHDREHTTVTWLDQLATHSDHRLLEPGRLRALLDALGEEIDRAGGRFVLHHDTDLFTARTDGGRDTP